MGKWKLYKKNRRWYLEYPGGKGIFKTYSAARGFGFGIYMVAYKPKEA